MLKESHICHFASSFDLACGRLSHLLGDDASPGSSQVQSVFLFCCAASFNMFLIIMQHNLSLSVCWFDFLHAWCVACLCMRARVAVSVPVSKSLLLSYVASPHVFVLLLSSPSPPSVTQSVCLSFRHCCALRLCCMSWILSGVQLQMPQCALAPNLTRQTRRRSRLQTKKLADYMH